MQWLGKIVIRILGLDALFVRRAEFSERLRVIDVEVGEARRQAWKAYTKQSSWDEAHKEYHRAQARRGDLDAEIEQMKQMKSHRDKVERAISGADSDTSPRSSRKSDHDADADPDD